MIYYKTNVLPPSIWLVCAVSNAQQRLGLPDMVITSANDSTHMVGSLHYVNRAIDIRSHHLTADQKDKLINYLRQQLPTPAYDVLFENAGTPNEHIHLEANLAQNLQDDTV